MPLESRHLELSEFETVCRQAAPWALFVSSRALRRVIKLHARQLSLGLRVPHRKSLVIRRDDLLELASMDELDLPAGTRMPERVVLLPRPSQQMLQSTGGEQILLKWWRLIFHSRVHLTLDELAAAGKWGAREAEAFIRDVGGAEWDEALLTLRQEEMLLPPRGVLSTVTEFAAVYLELRYFASELVPIYFPGIQDAARIDEFLAKLLDAEAIFRATRVLGAPLPADFSRQATERFRESPRVLSAPRVDLSSQRAFERLLARAERARELGNLVRSAVLRTRAAIGVGGELAKDTLAAADADVRAFVERLAAAIRLPEGEIEDWRQCLAALTTAAIDGRWSNEARLLYDLQKVCLDSERGIYALDLSRWILSFGKAPLKRPLPGQRDVLVSMRLHRAASRLSAVRLPIGLRDRLDAILRVAARRAELHLRSRLRPILIGSLEDERLVPQNLPEAVARNKLVDELLDRIVKRGFIAMSDLRDALSRNQLKMPDLATPRQFLLGDQLLRVDERLSARLDGVYRPGELYLRGPQRLSSIAFGTPLGRFLTRCVALPFGSAYVALAGLDHLIALIVAHVTPTTESAGELAVAADAIAREGCVGDVLASDVVASVAGESAVATHSAAGAEHAATFLATPWLILCVGMLLVGLINHRGFRAICGRGLKLVGRGLRIALIVWPSKIASLPAVQRFLASPQYRLLMQFIVKPLTTAALLTIVLPGALTRDAWRPIGLGLFVGANLLLNSRIGRNVDEVVSDWVVHAWHRIRIHIVASLFRFIVDLFHSLLEFSERLLYSVDEWLRFRSGERREVTLLKTVLGVAWAGVNYVLRFCINLLIEPQINPIKHFPVVTVSHKILLPTIPTLAFVLENHFHLGKAAALSLATTIIFGIPGIFGFLVWELKENWRLYAANRPLELRPVHVGHHNETLPQLLRPGFHSGRVPKLFARARKAARKAYWTGDWKPVQKQFVALHHQEEVLRRFVDRELVALLKMSRGWGGLELACGMIHLGCNRVLCELYCGALGEDSFWLSFVERHGALIAEVYRRGWLDRLNLAQRATLGNAVAGFYKLAGVDLVHEQVEARLPLGKQRFEVLPEGLALYGADGDTRRSVLPLRAGLRGAPDRDSGLGGLLPPSEAIESPSTSAAEPMPATRVRSALAETADIIFARRPITWRTWVVVWELDQLHGVNEQEILDRKSLLPR